MKFSLYRIKRFVSKKICYPELKVYSNYLFKRNNQNKKQVLIFAQGRSGSSLLEDLLCSTSHFNKRGEILGGLGTKIRFPYQYISGLVNRYSNENFIFHLKVYHLTRDRDKKIDPVVFLKKLQNNGWSFIYLYRKNRLNHYLSNKIAESRNAYHKYDNRKENFRLTINVDNLKQGIEERINFEKFELNALADINFIKIVYEEDLQNSANHQNTVNNIFDYLRLERRQSFTSMVKVNQLSQKDIIENYSEVAAFMKENGMSEYLE